MLNVAVGATNARTCRVVLADHRRALLAAPLAGTRVRLLPVATLGVHLEAGRFLRNLEWDENERDISLLSVV